MKKSLFTVLLVTILSIHVKGNFYQQENKYKDTSAILLKEVIVLGDSTKEIKTLSSETPEKNSKINGPLVVWMGVLVDEPFLFHKKLKTFSIYTENKKQSTGVFELEFFTLGGNGLPEKKLNTVPFEFSLYNKGWNEYEIPTHIEVPENGIIIVFRYKKRGTDWHHQENSVGLGVYTTNKKSYIFKEKEWKDFPIYEPYQQKYSKRVSMMLKISAYP